MKAEIDEAGPAGGRDVLLFGLSQTPGLADLLRWARDTPGLHAFVPDYHRLQLEHWIWRRRDRLGRNVLDVGVENPRRWIGPGYRALGQNGEGEDVHGDLLKLPFGDASLDGVVLTEVLEHCLNPPLAMGEVFRVLRPGGTLLVTSPFLWPWHGTTEYNDYWRFTAQGWQVLLGRFREVTIEPCAWTVEGDALYDLLRRFECWGHQRLTAGTTGYLCEGTKP